MILTILLQRFAGSLQHLTTALVLFASCLAGTLVLLAIICRPDVAFCGAALRFAPHRISEAGRRCSGAGRKSFDVSGDVCLGTSRVGAMKSRTCLSGTGNYLPRLV